MREWCVKGYCITESAAIFPLIPVALIIGILIAFFALTKWRQ